MVGVSRLVVLCLIIRLHPVFQLIIPGRNGKLAVLRAVPYKDALAGLLRKTVQGRTGRGAECRFQRLDQRADTRNIIRNLTLRHIGFKVNMG